MKSCTARLALNLGLAAVALYLTTIGNQWLFFLGLAMLYLSGLFSLYPRRPGSRMSWRSWGVFQWFKQLLFWSVLSILFVIFLWLSSWGRDGIDFRFACMLWIVWAIKEVGYWRASRTVHNNA